MKEEKFKNLTKSEKLKMKPIGVATDIKCSRIVFIPVRRKNDGYGMSACFLETPKGWIRVMDYDCFRFWKPDGIIKGDFEYGGIQFFAEKGFTYSYGNDFKCN